MVHFQVAVDQNGKVVIGVLSKRPQGGVGSVFLALVRFFIGK